MQNGWRWSCRRSASAGSSGWQVREVRRDVGGSNLSGLPRYYHREGGRCDDTKRRKPVVHCVWRWFLKSAAAATAVTVLGPLIIVNGTIAQTRALCVKT